MNYMKIKILGSGATQPAPRPCCDCDTCKKAKEEKIEFRTGPSIFIEDEKILIDTPEEIRQDLEKFQRLGFVVFGSLVLGRDEHKYPDSFIEIADILCSCKAPFTVHILVPFPGTSLYRKLGKVSRILTDDFSRYSFE